MVEKIVLIGGKFDGMVTDKKYGNMLTIPVAPQPPALTREELLYSDPVARSEYKTLNYLQHSITFTEGEITRAVNFWVIQGMHPADALEQVIHRYGHGIKEYSDFISFCVKHANELEIKVMSNSGYSLPVLGREFMIFLNRIRDMSR